MIKEFRIISAVDDNNKYMSFIPSVSEMWKNITGKKMILGFITNKKDTDPIILKLKEIVELIVFKPIDNIPTGNQAKSTRMYIASTLKDEKFMITDLDLYILNIKEMEKWLLNFDINKITTIGANAYFNSPENGKFPMCYTFGVGDILSNIINHQKMNYYDLFNSWKIIKHPIDNKEQISLPHHRFSDESLLRYLIVRNNKTDIINHIYREDFIGMTATKRIDRSNMIYDENKLHSDYYIDCSPERPLNIENMQKILNYLKIKTYDI